MNKQVCVIFLTCRSHDNREVHRIDLLREIVFGTSATLYQDKLTTGKKPTVGYSVPDEIPTTCFQLCDLV